MIKVLIRKKKELISKTLSEEIYEVYTIGTKEILHFTLYDEDEDNSLSEVTLSEFVKFMKRLKINYEIVETDEEIVKPNLSAICGGAIGNATKT